MPFHVRVDQLLAEGVWNAVVILREIQAEGYTGGATVLRGYITLKRSLRTGRAPVRFETPLVPRMNTSPAMADGSSRTADKSAPLLAS